MSWHVVSSGKQGCRCHWHHAASLLQSGRPCRPSRLYRFSKLHLQAVQPAGNVRVSLAVPSVSVVPTGPDDSVAASVKQESPTSGGHSSRRDDETTALHGSDGWQSASNASIAAPDWPRAALESREFTKDRGQTLPRNRKIVDSSSQRDTRLLDEGSGNGGGTSTSQRVFKAEVRDDVGGNVQEKFAGDSNRGSAASSSSGNAAKYAEEKVSLTTSLASTRPDNIAEACM